MREHFLSCALNWQFTICRAISFSECAVNGIVHEMLECHTYTFTFRFIHSKVQRIGVASIDSTPRRVCTVPCVCRFV